MSQFTKNIAGDVIGGIISATNLDEWKKNFQEMSKLIVVFDQFKNKSIETVKQQVDSAKSTSSPIVLDLNSNGIDTTGVKEGAYFDHASDGFAEQTGWINPSDALLVRDLNNNGYIDNGSELFGNETFINGVKAANGFEALKALDSNHDSQITSQDTDFGSLKLWIDTNGDGFSQNNELHTLAEEGVVSISTSYQNSTFVDGNGNAHRQVGSYTQADGTQAIAKDIWFAVDHIYSLANTYVSVPEDVAHLPNLSGYGVVRDLWQAIVFDTSGTLKTLISAYQTETDEGQRHSLTRDILYHWASADAVDPHSRGSYVDTRQLATLERFLGDAFYQAGWGANPGDTAGKKITAAFDDLSSTTFAQLEAQIRFSDLYAQIHWQWDARTQTLQADFTNVINTLQSHLNAEQVQGLDLLDGFVRNLKALGWMDASSWQSLTQGFANNTDALNILQLAQLATLTGSADSECLNGCADNERLLGFGGDDSLSGQGGDDVLEGGAGQDTLEGGTGNDILQGDADDDLLDGNAGSDIYLFQSGFGHDHIHQYDSAADSVDTARFVSLSSQDVVEAIRQGDDLSLNFTGGEQLTVEGYFDSAPRRVDVFAFADGAQWDVQAIKDRANTYGTAANDILYGYTSADNRIDGLAGNDELHGYTGNDRLRGGAGDDIIYGQSGDDLLDGGTGNDTLKGGTGNDSYYVDSTGDTVVEASGAGIDTVFSSVSYTLPAYVENLVLAADAGNGNGIGNSLGNVLDGNMGDNVLDGGVGTDTLTGGGGRDTFKLGSLTGGADRITDFQSGGDTLRLNDLATGLGLGDKDGVIDSAARVDGPGGFSASNELVIVAGDIIGSITTASAAAAIGAASSTYAKGFASLFIVDNGVDSALFKFTSSATDAQVSDIELTLVGTLQGAAFTVLSDYAFGV